MFNWPLNRLREAGVGKMIDNCGSFCDLCDFRTRFLLVDLAELGTRRSSSLGHWVGSGRGLLKNGIILVGLISFIPVDINLHLP